MARRYLPKPPSMRAQAEAFRREGRKGLKVGTAPPTIWQDLRFAIELRPAAAEIDPAPAHRPTDWVRYLAAVAWLSDSVKDDGSACDCVRSLVRFIDHEHAHGRHSTKGAINAAAPIAGTLIRISQTLERSPRKP